MGTSVGPSPTGQLVQTIFNLRQLQQRDEAQKLAREQFGLQQSEFGQNQASAQEAQVAQLTQILQNTQDPQALMQHIPELSQKTGYSEGLLKTLMQNVKPSTETTRAGAVSRGVAAAGGAIDQPAAYSTLVGQQPGQLSADTYQKTLMDAAKEIYSTLPADQKAAFDQGVAQKAATGQHPGEAAIDIALSHLPKQQLTLAAQIGANLVPGASQDAQLKLGYSQLRVQQQEIIAQSADREAAIMAGLREAQMKAKPEQTNKIVEILSQLRQAQSEALNNASTYTKIGKTINNATMNALLEQLRQIAPDIYGRVDPKTGKPVGGPIPLPDIPLDADFGATGAFSGFLRGMRIK
jgi:hypothetical protein